MRDLRDVAADIDFAVDVTEPRNVRLSRFEDILRELAATVEQETREQDARIAEKFGVEAFHEHMETHSEPWRSHWLDRSRDAERIAKAIRQQEQE